MNPKFTWSRNDVGPPRSDQFHQFLPHWNHILLLSSHSDVIHVYRQEQSLFPMNTDRIIPCFRSTNIHSQFGTFPIQVLVKLVRIVFPKEIPLMEHTPSRSWQLVLSGRETVRKTTTTSTTENFYKHEPCKKTQCKSTNGIRTQVDLDNNRDSRLC